MKFTFAPGRRSTKAMLAIIREAVGRPLYRDENADRPIGTVKTIEYCEDEYYPTDSYYVADCQIDEPGSLPEGFDANAPSLKGFVVKVKTRAGSPDDEAIVGFYLER